jgi:predicted neutral ceramidase superfamily lipid hydrolase
VSDLSFRPRSATEIVDGTFRLYREHFVSFLTLSTLTYLPIIALVIPILWVVTRAPDNTAVIGFLVIALGAVFLFWYPVMWGALMLSVSERYLGRSIETGEAMGRAFGRFGPLVGSWLAKWFVIFLGFILGFFLLGAPGFYLVTRWFAVPATVLLEDRGVAESFRRSSQLSAGQKGRIFGTLCLSWLILFGISIAVSMVVMTILIAVVATRGPDAMGGTSSLLTQLPSLFAYILGLPITVITQTLLYYDARIRQEGYDIELMSAQLGGAANGVATH